MLNSKNTHVKLAWGAFQKAPPQTQGSVITGLMNKLGTFREENAQKVCAPITAGDRSAGVRQIEFGRLRQYGTVIYIVWLKVMQLGIRISWRHLLARR